MTKKTLLLITATFALLTMGAGYAKQEVSLENKTTTAPTQEALSIEVQHFNGLNNCADAMLIKRGEIAIFEARLADCKPSTDPVDPSGKRFIYEYKFSQRQGKYSVGEKTTFTWISETDPKFTLLDEENKKHPNQIWLKVNEKTIVFDELNHTFTESATSIAGTAGGLTPWATKACPAPGSMGRLPSGKFQGVAISDIAKNYLALSGSKADALTAITSTDDRRLVIAYESCDGAAQDGGRMTHLVQFIRPAAINGVMFAQLSSFSGSNFEAMFLPVGFIGETSQVLMKGQIFNSGAGGSCATTRWMTIDANKDAATTTFTTAPNLLVYGKNTKIVYVSPSGCMEPPYSIHIKDVTTLTDQLVIKIEGYTSVSLQKVEELNATFVLHYTTHDSNRNSTAVTLVLP